MFKKLKQRWGVNGWQLLLILTTFAAGGSLCGFAGRKILSLFDLHKGFIWIVLYILIVTILWPLAVLLVSLPLGQFRFFKNYIKKIINKLSGRQSLTRIAIFASGTGTNAKNILEYFSGSPSVKIELLVCNNPEAGVIKIAEQYDVPVLLISKDFLHDASNCLLAMKKHQINLVVMAGFLWKIPPTIIDAYAGRILNIHPALLPKYGGKGMYGKNVHEAVLANKENESGITIHIADEQYDHGKILFQATCRVDQTDTAETLAGKIHQLEMAHYPAVIDEFTKKQKPA